MAIIIGDKTYSYTQLVPSLEWLITHELDKYPSVDCFNSSGESIKGKVNHINVNSLTITFTTNVAGKVYLN